MLSVILIVMLAGAAGLLAYSIAEGELPFRHFRGSDQGSLSASDDDDTAPARSRPSVPAASSPPPAPTPPPVARVAGRGPVPVARDTEVPTALTALEGQLREVTTPWWRRLISLAVLVVVLLVLSVVVAAIVGAVVGAVAEIVTGAIG